MNRKSTIYRAVRGFRASPIVLLQLVSMFAGNSAWAQASAERVANIEKAAAELAAEEERRGANGGQELLQACYSRELATAKSLTPGLEACITQDVIHSQISAHFFGNMLEKAPDLKVPKPQAVLQAMAKRVYGVLGNFKGPESDGRVLTDAIKKQGMDSYARPRFPKDPSKK